MSQLLFFQFQAFKMILHHASPADLGVLRWGYKKSREFARRMASYRGEFKPGHPRYPEGSQAATNASTGPVDVSSPDITYSTEDDEAIDTYHRENGVYILLRSILVECSLSFS
jgi:hypothetical protein